MEDTRFLIICKLNEELNHHLQTHGYGQIIFRKIKISNKLRLDIMTFELLEKHTFRKKCQRSGQTGLPPLLILAKQPVDYLPNRKFGRRCRLYAYDNRAFLNYLSAHQIICQSTVARLSIRIRQISKNQLVP